VRSSLCAVALTLLVAGCGSAKSHAQTQTVGVPGSLQSLWDQSGQAVGLIQGTTDYSRGDVRLSFLVVDNHGRVVATKKARVWLSDSLTAKPSQQTVARLEDVGVPGVTTSVPVKSLYVAHLRIPTAGTYYVLARPVGGVRIGSVGQITVRAHSRTPEVGDRAFPSRTPTLGSVHGRAGQLTTRVPPDKGLLHYSIADSLAKHIPFVVTFATPRWCSSRTCGPVVDVVEHERQAFAGSPIRFIHVEIYAKNDPRKGYNTWYRQWRLPSEPWTFLVGRDGRIKAKFGGSVSMTEMGQAIRRLLL
jgi:hypothetical protein